MRVQCKQHGPPQLFLHCCAYACNSLYARSKHAVNAVQVYRKQLTNYRLKRPHDRHHYGLRKCSIKIFGDPRLQNLLGAHTFLCHEPCKCYPLGPNPAWTPQTYYPKIYLKIKNKKSAHWWVPLLPFSLFTGYQWHLVKTKFGGP